MRLALLAELLELVCEIERGLQLLGVPGADADEVPSLEVLRDLDHARRRMLRASRSPLREQHAQALEAGEHAALDRPERLVEPFGELGLGEPAVVGELDRLALLGRQTAQGVLDDLAARARDDRFVGARVRALRLVDDGRCARRLLTADEVDGAAVDERQQPRARLGALGPVRAGAAPDLEERLLDGVFGESRVLQDLVREAVGDLAEAVVELAERVLVGPGDGFDEFLVRALRGRPGSSAARPRGRGAPPRRWRAGSERRRTRQVASALKRIGSVGEVAPAPARA